MFLLGLFSICIFVWYLDIFWRVFTRFPNRPRKETQRVQNTYVTMRFLKSTYQCILFKKHYWPFLFWCWQLQTNGLHIESRWAFWSLNYIIWKMGTVTRVKFCKFNFCLSVRLVCASPLLLKFLCLILCVRTTRQENNSYANNLSKRELEQTKYDRTNRKKQNQTN